MSAAHTPGPWSAAEGGHVYAPDLTLVAVAQHGRQKEANARLVAAAPELLEALIACAERLALHMKHTEDLIAHMQAHKAIAKATGEQA